MSTSPTYTLFGFDYTILAELATKSYNGAVEGIKSFGTSAYNFGALALSTAAPYVKELGEKIKTLWTQTVPYLVAFGAFLQSPLGIASVLLLSAIIVIKISELTENTTVKTTLLAAGIVAAMGSGIFFFTSGSLPDPILAMINKASAA